MKLFRKVLERDEFKDKPPVLLDVGASKELNPKWKAFAKHAVCIAFDADDRKIGFMVKEDSRFKKLYSYNCIVSSTGEAESDFYLTRSPYCSSLLEPNREVLAQWHYAPMFDVVKVTKTNSKELKDVFAELGLGYVDWFKTDSQGTDLRLFQNIGPEMMGRVLVAEFEPGLQQFYKGEDTFLKVLDFMERRDFWISEITVKGSQRITHDNLTQHFSPFQQKLAGVSMKTSPGWVEVEYINGFRCQELGQREHLLGWVFATARDQHGFALNLAKQGAARFRDPIFDELLQSSVKSIRGGWIKMPLYYFNKAYKKYVKWA